VISVCRVSDVPLGEGRVVRITGRCMALFHTAVGWFALDDACPHRGGPLSAGILSDRCVTCPLHDRRFELTTGAALTDGEDVVAHRVELRGQRVLVRASACARGRFARRSPLPEGGSYAERGDDQSPLALPRQVDDGRGA